MRMLELRTFLQMRHADTEGRRMLLRADMHLRS